MILRVIRQDLNGNLIIMSSEWRESVFAQKNKFLMSAPDLFEDMWPNDQCYVMQILNLDVSLPFTDLKIRDSNFYIRWIIGLRIEWYECNGRSDNYTYSGSGYSHKLKSGEDITFEIVYNLCPNSVKTKLSYNLDLFS